MTSEEFLTINPGDWVTFKRSWKTSNIFQGIPYLVTGIDLENFLVYVEREEPQPGWEDTTEIHMEHLDCIVDQEPED